MLAAADMLGSEACVYPSALAGNRIKDLTQVLEHKVIVTDQNLYLDGVDLVSIDSLGAHHGALDFEPIDHPVLVLTTGTSGFQRGVRYQWPRLVTGVKGADRQPGTRWLFAYDLNQFGGLQTMIHAVKSQASLVVPATRRAQDVVQALSEFSVTHASGTPTFWRMIVRALDSTAASDLRLRQVTLGGEAVTESLLEDIKTLLPKARISQIYGASEFGMGISVNDGRNGLPLSILERSESSDVQFRIVDGELQVRSRIGMLGYHGEQDVKLDWRPTGDLVEIRDGRVQFLGRVGERINVGGVKVHPLPIEEAVTSIDGVALAHAYGHPSPVTGQIVGLDVVAEARADTARLEKAIREACQDLPQAFRPRRIRFVDQLDIVSSKILRVPGTH
jgi:acyl-CoA synthetase (AMP-forming)/AMP-acid ligase II